MTNIFENVNGIFGNSVGIGTLVSCLLVLAITKPVTWLAGMEIEAAQMCFGLVIAMTVVKPLVWVGAFGLPYGLRAAGDVKFSMIASVSIMWGCRVALGIFLVRAFHFGLMGVDWNVRRLDCQSGHIYGTICKREMASLQNDLKFI